MRKERLLYPKIKIEVIGLGGGGISVVSDVAGYLKKIKFLALDTDFGVLKRASKKINTYLLGKDITKGQGTGLDCSLAKEIVQKEKEKIIKILKNKDLIIFVSCFGGGVGSGMMPILAEISHKLGVKTIGFFTFPFKFEGQKKFQIAQEAFEKTRGFLNASLYIPNDNIFKVVKEGQQKKPFSLSLKDSLFLINKILIENLKDLISIIYEPGVINVDFADFQTILAPKGKFLFFNTVEARGQNKSEEIIKNLFQTPLIEYNLVGERVLFNIAGGGDLKTLDIQKIGSFIAQKNPGSRIIFGISKEKKFNDRIKTTILIIGDREKEIGDKEKEKKEKKKISLKSKSFLLKKRAIKTKKRDKKQKSEVLLQEKKEDLLKDDFQRKNAIEIKKEEEEKEIERLAEEKELEIPSFLRKKIF